MSDAWVHVTHTPSSQHVQTAGPMSKTLGDAAWQVSAALTAKNIGFPPLMTAAAFSCVCARGLSAREDIVQYTHERMLRAGWAWQCNREQCSALTPSSGLENLPCVGVSMCADAAPLVSYTPPLTPTAHTHTGGGLNFMGVASALEIDSVAVTSALAVDNALGLLYFPLCGYLCRFVPASQIAQVGAREQGEGSAAEEGGGAGETHTLDSVAAALCMGCVIAALADKLGAVFGSLSLSLFSLRRRHVPYPITFNPPPHLAPVLPPP